MAVMAVMVSVAMVIIAMVTWVAWGRRMLFVGDHVGVACCLQVVRVMLEECRIM